jgi:hypothetical protein
MAEAGAEEVSRRAEVTEGCGAVAAGVECSSWPELRRNRGRSSTSWTEQKEEEGRPRNIGGAMRDEQAG